jgi:hypothetical protein
LAKTVGVTTTQMPNKSLKYIPALRGPTARG